MIRAEIPRPAEMLACCIVHCGFFTAFDIDAVAEEWQSNKSSAMMRKRHTDCLPTWPAENRQGSGKGTFM